VKCHGWERYPSFAAASEQGTGRPYYCLRHRAFHLAEPRAWNAGPHEWERIRRVNATAWALALELAGGDLRRIRVIDARTVIVR
jgi:hypothetical protein